MRDAIELFAGSGILGRAARDVGLVDRVRVQVEIDPFARAVLERHEPGAARIADVRDARDLGHAFAVLGGFPCQDLSVAGNGAGLSGARSGLWSEFRRIVGESRPRVVVIENAGRGWKRWVPVVRSDLHTLGYSSVPILMSASEIGAPHHRLRCFLVAAPHADGERLRILSGGGSGSGGAARAALAALDGARWVAADVGGEPLRAGAERRPDGETRREPGASACRSASADADRLRQLQQERREPVIRRWARHVRDREHWAEWPARAVVPRVDDGMADGLLASDRRFRPARERLCGNGIVYPVALVICGAVAEVFEGA